MDTTDRELETGLGGTRLRLASLTASLARGGLATIRVVGKYTERVICLDCVRTPFPCQTVEIEVSSQCIRVAVSICVPFVLIEECERVWGAGDSGGEEDGLG